MEQGLTEYQALEALQHKEATTIVSQPQRRIHWKSDDIGTFDGNRANFQFWVDRVTALWDKSVDPCSREPLIDALPTCLRDDAAEWYQGLSKEERQDLTSWERWEAAMSSYFSMPNVELRKLADSRSWEPRKEDISAYYQAKKRLLRQAYPEKDAAQIVDNIRDGLPASMRLLVRTPYSRNPDPVALLRELFTLERDYMDTIGVKRGATAASTSAAQRPTATISAGRLSPDSNRGRNKRGAIIGPSWPRGASLEESYDPRRVSNKRGVKIYKVPDSDHEIVMNRPCKTCNGDHFDFAHNHHMGKSPKKEMKGFKREPSFWVAGYPCYDGSHEVWIEDGSESEYEDIDEDMSDEVMSSPVSSQESSPSRPRRSEK